MADPAVGTAATSSPATAALERAEEVAPGPPAAPRAWRSDGAVLLLFLALAGLLFAPAWGSPRDTWIGIPGDAPQFMWYLRWVPYALSHGEPVLLANFLNYPDGVNLMWNTSVILPAVVLSPVTLVFGPVVAYNALMTLAVALSAGCAYLMLRRYVWSRTAAAVGGLLYGFSPYMISHTQEHPNLPMAFVPPLMFLLLDEILVRQRRSPVATGVLLGLLAAAQLLISEELLATEAVVATAALVLLIALHPREARSRPRVRHGAIAILVAAAVSLTLTAGPLITQFHGPQRVESGRLWGPDIFVSDLFGFVVPTQHQQLRPGVAGQVTGEFTDRCCPAEWNAYLGVPLIALLVLASIRLRRQGLVRFSALLALLLVLLSLGPHLHVGGRITGVRLPFSVISELPVFGNILAGRLMLYVYLLAAVIVGAFIDDGLRSSRPRPALLTAVVGVALAPLFPALPMPASGASTPSFFTSGRVQMIRDGSVALVAPLARDTSTSEPMLWQAESGMRFRMPEGYVLGPDRQGRFSYLPLETSLSAAMRDVQRGEDPVLTPDLRHRIEGDLRARDVDNVIVGPMQHRQDMVDFFRTVLGRDPEQVGGVQLWRGLRQRPGTPGRR